MANNYFQFKRFTILQDRSAMKVGTDSVLLGAWADITSAGHILDAGAGTGVIALMMAQRSGALIDAIEIEREAYEECTLNVNNSPWSSRINVYNLPFNQYATLTPNRYDLVITNPPFYENQYQPSDPRRKIARHTPALTFENLLQGAFSLLSRTGKLALVLPADEAGRFEKIAAEAGLYPERKLVVRPNPLKNPNRILTEFVKRPALCRLTHLTIETAKHHEYTPEYKQLTRDFYLAF